VSDLKAVRAEADEEVRQIARSLEIEIEEPGSGKRTS